MDFRDGDAAVAKYFNAAACDRIFLGFRGLNRCVKNEIDWNLGVSGKGIYLEQ